MDLDTKDMIAIFTALATVLGGFLGYFRYRSRRDKMEAIREAFHTVVSSLASEAEVERVASAILLRRFFDRKSELGRVGILSRVGTPYASEAINVMAAVLRTQQTGSFQKLLADGLAYAPSLRGADLQRTNLQNAYLGVRKRGESTREKVLYSLKKTFLKKVEIDLRNADFFRADLSGASLKGATATSAAFYEARLHDTVFTGADLCETNFVGADLLGAKFGEAKLARAKFEQARNIPPALDDLLDEDGMYPNDDQPFEADPDSQGATAIRVFLSKPGVLDDQQRQFVDHIRSMIKGEDMVSETLERSEYPRFGTLAEVRRLMSGCAGAIIFGFRELNVLDGVWRSGTAEEKKVRDVQLPTPWNQIEAGMAAMRGLPILLVCQHGVTSGVFDLDDSDYVYRVKLPADERSHALQKRFADWCATVREQARAG
jgi:uncharacterized protein YjbI with pentapeptide repeats